MERQPSSRVPSGRWTDPHRQPAGRHGVEIWRYAHGRVPIITSIIQEFPLFLVTATNSDMKKVGNTFLQLKLVLDKGTGTEDVFMGEL